MVFPLFRLLYNFTALVCVTFASHLLQPEPKNIILLALPTAGQQCHGSVYGSMVQKTEGKRDGRRREGVVSSASNTFLPLFIPLESGGKLVQSFCFTKEHRSLKGGVLFFF